ncbi:MAG: 50S ribosomal protein L32 [Candidatus Berkelbacteria bacterium]|nr:MAG: 50S ribosomal protein L32 [Candidatus Berkelbacteria bacterium]QQG52133.1 MAG: 50S ribosomal protein L32 [Candidatus Berkelbacteria bacterium]
MAEPKKRLSKTRTHLRRAQYKINAPKVAVCSNCHEPKLPHIICPHCGFYRGKLVKSNAPTKRIRLNATDEVK